MAGAEFLAVLGIGASVVQIVEGCNRVLSRIKEFRRNSAFQDIALQLPLLAKDIQALNTPEYRQFLDSETESALVRVLEGCHRQLVRLDKLIQSLTPTVDSSKFTRTVKGIRSFGTDTKLREIMGILNEYRSTITLHVSSHQAHTSRNSDISLDSVKTFFDVPAIRVAHFVDRTQILERIESTIAASTVTPVVVPLTGIGGQGKTQIALEFCRRSTQFKAIFWIDASSRASTHRSFERITNILSQAKNNFPDSQANIDYVRKTLRNWPCPWLLVFDNYDSPGIFDNIMSFFPDSKPDVKNVILVTSRRVSSESLGLAIKIDGLTEEEGIKLLQLRSSLSQISAQESEEAKLIVHKLGYLALAIDQAAAYISIRHLPLHLFLEHYEKRESYILKHTPETAWQYRERRDDSTVDPGKNLSALTTWELSFEQISGDNREAIGDFLTQCAFFDPTNISECLFSNFHQHCTDDDTADTLEWMSPFLHQGKWDSLQFQDVIATLTNLSLIQPMDIAAKVLKFSLHPLIKVWLQLRNPPGVRQRCTFIATAITAALVQDEDVERLSLQMRQSLLGHIDSCIENARQHLSDGESTVMYGGHLNGFQTTFATFYARHDRLADAKDLFQKTLYWQKTKLGVSDGITLRTLNNLGALHLDMKETEKAQYFLQQAADAKETVFGPNHHLTLNTINNIGNLYVVRRQLNDATVMYQKALNGYLKLYGTTHPAIVQAMNNLGEVAMKKGEFKAAERLFLEALEKAQAIANTENALVLYVKSNIAIVLHLQDRHPEAIELSLQVTAGRQTLMGSDHSSTLSSMCELGDIYRDAGQLSEADRWYDLGKASLERRMQRVFQGKFMEKGSPASANPDSRKHTSLHPEQGHLCSSSLKWD